MACKQIKVRYHFRQVTHYFSSFNKSFLESISELDAIIANFNNVGQEQNENQDLLLEDEKVVKEGEG